VSYYVDSMTSETSNLEVDKIVVYPRHVPMYYRPKGKFDVVTLSEVTKYINHAKTDEMKRAISLAWLSGMRLIQLRRLMVEDININENEKEVIIFWNGAKGGKDVYQTYGFDDPFINEYIISFKNRMPPETSVLRYSKRTYERWINYINKEIYPDKVEKWITFHYFRHARITHLIRKLDMLPQDVKDFTGHSSDAFEVYFKQQKSSKIKGRYAEKL
jgi:integrase